MVLRRTPRGMVNTGTRIRPLIPKITKRLRRQQYGQGGGAVVAGYVWCIDNDGTNYGYVRGDYGSITPDTTRASGTEIEYVYVSDTDTMHVGFEMGAYLPGISTFIIDLPNGMSFPIYWDMVNHEYNGFETGLTVYAQSLQGTCINIEITHLDHTAVMWMAAFNNAPGEMQTQLIGQGTPETDHSMPMLAPDHESTYQTFDVDEPVWSYGRVHENEFLYSEDIDNSILSPSVSGTGQVVFNADGSATCIAIDPGTRAFLIGSQTTIVGHDYILRLSVIGNTGFNGQMVRILCTPEMRMYLQSGTNEQTIEFTASSTSTNMRIGIGPVTGTGEIAGSVTLTNIQIEDATGRSDTTTPSEYLSTTTAPVKIISNYANGNTVDGNGVVTEARGDYLIPQPHLVEQEEATNLCLNPEQEASQNITLSATGTYTLLVFGDGASATVSAGTATGTGFGTSTPDVPVEIDITGTGTVSIVATAPLAINFLAMTAEEALSVQPITTGGATTGPLKPQFDAANHDNNDGAYYTNVDNTGDDVVLMSDGLYDFLKIESGNVILDDGTNQLQLPIPGPNHVLNGKFIQDLNHWNTSGTDGGNTVRWSNGRAFMSTTSLQSSFMQTGLLNIGTDYVLDVDIEIVAGDVNFLSDGTDIALVDGHNTVPFTAAMDGVLFRRGATLITQVYFDNVVVREATPTEQTKFFSVGAVYEGDVAGVNQMNLNVDGVWAADTTYDGSLGTGDIVLGETQHAVTRYQGGTYQEKKAKIDERMP